MTPTAKDASFVVALLIASQPVMAGSILGSAHDFTPYAWSRGQVCIACHDSHNANHAITAAPMWNHAVSTQTYTLYGSPSMKATVGQPGQLSKLCLSCHDGTVAVDSFGGGTGGQYISNANNIRPALNDDHPIGFVYDSALASADGTLFDPVSKSVTIGSGSDTQTGTLATLMLFSGQMECASCHDVHNKFTVGTSGLVRLDPAGAMCKACHNK